MWALLRLALLTKAAGLVMAGVYGIIRIATMAGIINTQCNERIDCEMFSDESLGVV